MLGRLLGKYPFMDTVGLGSMIDTGFIGLIDETALNGL
jgi:hypothetical protein